MRSKKLNENKFKTPFHKAKAAIHIRGRERGKSEEEIKQDMQNFFAKKQAIKDINKDRSIRTMSKRDRMYNNQIVDDTFNIDFSDLDYYHPYYDDYSKNNKPVEGGHDYYGYFGYGGDDYVDESIKSISIKDKRLLESLTKKYGKNYIINELASKIKVPAGREYEFEDDYVELYNDKGELMYKGIFDYCPDKDYIDDYGKWNPKDKNYDLPNNWKMVCI